MRFIWIAITVILGLIMFLLVKDHFIWSIPYVVLHLSIIALLKFRGLLDFSIPTAFVPLLFIGLQLIYSIYGLVALGNMGLEEELYNNELKMSFIRIGVLLVEYPLLLEFFKKPKFNRY
ncbi:MAG: hypothetical protein JXQ87_09175 [Bacteroidia bacterium]